MTLLGESDSSPRLAAAALPKKKARQIFVAYPYRIYDRDDYRRVFKEVEKAFQVKFVFADEKISTLHILEKIRQYILESELSIYDITGWNSNVTLELGLALGLGETAFIAFDPSKTDVDEVPSDLRGIDRMQYSSFHGLQEVIERLVAQELPVPTTHDVENQLTELRESVLRLVTADEGLKIADIAKALGVTTDLAQVVVRPLVGAGLRTEGERRGTKYFRS